MIQPANTYQINSISRPNKLHKGLDQLTHDLLGQFKRRNSIQKKWFEIAQSIHDSSSVYRDVSDSELRGIINNYRQCFRRRGKYLDELLPEVLSVLVEATDRSLGMRPFPVQILGAILIYHGCLAEMATGEGKSLTACLPAILFAWSGRPCHIVTANDYLASRDAQLMAPLYRFCHLTTGWVSEKMTTPERKDNYFKGIVYTTSKELLADFLRDRLLLGENIQASRRLLRNHNFQAEQRLQGVVMRGIDAAIIDEADSVLIDEAVTPLIISQNQQNLPLTNAILAANQLAQKLTDEQDYRINKRYREIILTERGKKQIAELTTSMTGLWLSEKRREELILTALSAKELYQKDRQYVIEDGKVVIVDELTGRMMPQRTWRQGLHQSVEAREGLPLSDPSETLARLSFQRFFRFFRKLGGMTGTAQEASKELWHIYNLPVMSIPTNRPCIRKHLPSRYYPNSQNKWQAICEEVATTHKTGQPVLIGSRNIDTSEHLATLLREKGIPFRLLNAIKHHEEAKIVTSAGQLGSVTIATNMAGRGTDIKLGEGVAKLGGLHIIVVEHNESRRIDRQLIGRCARQGQPGSVRIYGSLDDELLKRYALKPLMKLLSTRLNNVKPEQQNLFYKAITMAQQSAQQQSFKQRELIMQMDDWLSESLSFAPTGFE